MPPRTTTRPPPFPVWFADLTWRTLCWRGPSRRTTRAWMTSSTWPGAAPPYPQFVALTVANTVRPVIGGKVLEKILKLTDPHNATQCTSTWVCRQTRRWCWRWSLPGPPTPAPSPSRSHRLSATPSPRRPTVVFNITRCRHGRKVFWLWLMSNHQPPGRLRDNVLFQLQRRQRAAAFKHRLQHVCLPLLVPPKMPPGVSVWNATSAGLSTRPATTR